MSPIEFGPRGRGLVFEITKSPDKGREDIHPTTEPFIVESGEEGIVYGLLDSGGMGVPFFDNGESAGVGAETSKYQLRSYSCPSAHDVILMHGGLQFNGTGIIFKRHRKK